MHRKEVTHSNGSYEKKSRRRAWLKKWDKVKIPWYIHRLMHRKRVTCELHDSYFRLVTIRHAIPKSEWAIELLYNSVKTGSQWVGVQWSEVSEEDVVEKATTRQKGPSGPPESWRSDELERRCGRESNHLAERGLRDPQWVWRPVGEKRLRWEHVSERLGLRPSGWAVVQENENDTRLYPEGLVRSIYCNFCSVSNPLSHTTFQIKWEVYLFKDVFARLYSLRQYVFCMYMCIYAYLLYEYTTLGYWSCEIEFSMMSN